VKRGTLYLTFSKGGNTKRGEGVTLGNADRKGAAPPKIGVVEDIFKRGDLWCKGGRAPLGGTVSGRPGASVHF